jgi:Domain of unknown function (DUF1707)
MVTPAPGHGPMRASHADRERVVDVLKAAFVQGRLTQDELDARAGQALAALTCADLAALTADLPAEPDRAPASALVPARPTPRNRTANKAVKVGAGAIGAVILVFSSVVAALGEPAAAVVLAIFFVLLTAATTAVVAGLIAAAVKFESRRQNRSRGELPPGADGPAADGTNGPASARPRRRRPPGSLVLGRAS